MLVAQRSRRDGRAHGALRLEGPPDAPGIDVERLHLAAGAAYKQIAIEHRGLREGHDVAIEAVGPLQLEPPYLVEAQAGCGRWLEARIGGGRAPSVPFRFAAAGELHRAVGAIRLAWRRWRAAGRAQICRHRFALLMP